MSDADVDTLAISLGAHFRATLRMQLYPDRMVSLDQVYGQVRLLFGDHPIVTEHGRDVFVMARAIVEMLVREKVLDLQDNTLGPGPKIGVL